MTAEEDNKMAHATDTPASREESDEAQPDREVIIEGDDQRGLQNVEAVTLSWSKTSLILVFLKYVLTFLSGEGNTSFESESK